MQYVSLAETVGLDPAAMWTLAWTLFFIRVGLGFAVGIDDVVNSFRSLDPDANKHKAQARSLRRGNNVVTALHVAMLAAFAFAVPYIPST